MEQEALLTLAGIVVGGVAAQWVAWRLGLPSILVLLAGGLVVGPITGVLDPDETFGELLLPGISLAVAIVLFEGGLSLGPRELRAAGNAARNLVTVGAAITAGLCAVAARYVLDIPWEVAVLLGAILSVTGPTVIGPLLRHVRPLGRVGPVLRAEGILIDPIGAVAAVLVFEAVFASEVSDARWAVLTGIVRTLVVGGVVGAAAAGLIILTFSRYWVPDLLHNSLTLATVLAAFTVSDVLQEESGLLSVTVMGIVLASQRRVEVGHVLEFSETLTVLLISAMFIVLAARMDGDAFADVAVRAVVFTAVLIVAVRPISVLVATTFTGLTLPQRLFVAWMAPRGIVAAAVASVFALRLEAERLEGADVLVPATFTVIIGTIAVYGLTARRVATRLGVAEPNPQGVLILAAHPLSQAIAEALEQRGVDVTLVDLNRGQVITARMAGLDTYYGSILSEQALDSIELGRIGHFLALSSNDEVNTLAVQRLRPVLDRSRVYQVSPQAERTPRQRVPAHLGGRMLFGKGLDYPELASRLEAGAAVKATHLGEAFGWSEFRSTHPDAVLLFVVTDAGTVKVATTDTEVRPEPGDTVISLQPAPATTPPPAAGAAGTEAAGAAGTEAAGAAETAEGAEGADAAGPADAPEPAGG